MRPGGPRRLARARRRGRCKIRPGSTPPGRVTRAISRQRLSNLGDVGEHLERAGDVEARVRERQLRHASLAHVEPARARLLEHPGDRSMPAAWRAKPAMRSSRRPVPHPHSRTSRWRRSVARGRPRDRRASRGSRGDRSAAVALVADGELVVVGPRRALVCLRAHHCFPSSTTHRSEGRPPACVCAKRTERLRADPPFKPTPRVIGVVQPEGPALVRDKRQRRRRAMRRHEAEGREGTRSIELPELEHTR